MAAVLFVPSWNGDVRFESLDDGKAVEVTVHDPTAAETEALEKLLSIARERGWTKLEEVPKPAGRFKRWRKSTFRLDGPMAEVGQVFVGLVRPAKSSITALRFSNGEVHVTEAAGTREILAKAEESKDGGARLASVKRATPCCPQCIPGSIAPASEVLLSFLTPQQHADWAKHRTIEVEGGTTGHRYLLAHRHTERAQRWGRICFDADDRGVVHFHDWSHPPEEEVLGAMLVLQHRESWLRNEATCVGPQGHRFRHVLKNPFGGVADGIADARLMAGIGSGLATLMREAERGKPRSAIGKALDAEAQRGIEMGLLALSEGRNPLLL